MAKAKSTSNKTSSYFENFRTFHKQTFSEEAKAKFLEVYAETGRLTYAAECALVCGQTVRRHLKSDPEFAAAFEEAKQMYGDKIQKEIERRAMEGWDEPIINFRDNTIVDTVRKYSDRLLELASKRYIPEYRDKLEIDATVNAGVLVVTTPEQISPEDWAAKLNPKNKS